MRRGWYVMKPIKVEFQAFGPYKGREMVDFEKLSSKGLFLICGKTGIGKTMIIDAMTFALYGKSSGHGRDNFEAMRCTKVEDKTDTFVKFEFENDGKRYLFERRLVLKRTNLSPEYNLMYRDAASPDWNTMFDNAKEDDLNKTAVEVIGLEYEQFRQVMVLPQGQFERLLTSNSAEKEEILAKIFGENKWQVIANNFYKEALDRKNSLNEIDKKIKNSLKDEKCDSISQLYDVIEAKKEEIDALKRSFDEKEYSKTKRQQQELLAIANRFDDLHKAEKQVKELEAKNEDCEQWKREYADAKRAENVRALIENASSAKKAYDERKNAEEAFVKDAENKKGQADAAVLQLKAHAEQEAGIEEKKAAIAQYEEKRTFYESIDAAEKDMKAKEAALKKANDAEQDIKNKCDGFVGVIDRLNAEYSRLQEEHKAFLNSYLSGITGELAKTLKDDEPCPVCGSRNHPVKAHVSDNNVTKDEVDSKKAEEEQKYDELRKQMAAKEEAGKELEAKKNDTKKADAELAAARTHLDGLRNNLVSGIATLGDLNSRISKLSEDVDMYFKVKSQLEEAERNAKEAYTQAYTQAEAARKETGAADSKLKQVASEVAIGLKENQFESQEEAERYMMPADKLDRLNKQIADYEASVRSADDMLKGLMEELEEKEEPDKEKVMDELQRISDAEKEYSAKYSVMQSEADRLQDKADKLKTESDGLVDKIAEAETDCKFATSLRGKTGVGLQRYVLGIMFSSVITAANKMLEMVHDGRYRLFRSDDKAQGTNKRGLELKVFDKNSAEHGGRFVNTLSGGEKFLVSLALSIGMSTVAKKSGIKVDALFIDEGFGSLDDDSIGDAIAVLNSIREADGFVGIISHVQLLYDNIPVKLEVKEGENGSCIVQSVG